MKLRDLSYGVFLFGSIGLMIYWGETFSGPLRWVAEQLGFTTTPHHRSPQFLLIFVIVWLPFLAVLEVWNRLRQQQTPSCPTSAGSESTSVP